VWLLCCGITLISGCNNSITKPEETQRITKKVDEYLSVDINYDLEVKNYYQVTVKAKTYKEELVKSIFFKNNNTEKRVWTNNIGFTLYNKEYELRKDVNYFTYVRTADFENYLFLVNKDNAMSPGVVRNDLKEYFFRDSLESLNRESCKVINDNYLEKLGVSLTAVEYYALDNEGLNQLEQYLLPDEKYEELIKMGSLPNGRFREWNKDQEAYIFINQLRLDGIPIYNISYSTDGKIVENDFGYAWSILDKNGLIYLSVGSLIGEEIKRDKVNIINMSEALEKITRIYQNRFITTSVCINHVELIYIPIKDEKENIILMPAWKFQTVIGEDGSTKSVTKDQSDNMIVTEYTIINAVTGEVLS